MAITPLRLPHDPKGQGAPTGLPGRTATMVDADSEAMLINLPQMAGFAVEQYEYGATGSPGTGITKFQLVAYGDGPGWGPDYTQFSNQGRISFTKDDSAQVLGPTEGKYVLYAGLDRASLENVLDFIFGELAGATNVTNPQA